MADNVIEETDNYPGKDELEWGYEEGKDSIRESLLILLFVKHETLLSHP